MQPFYTAFDALIDHREKKEVKLTIKITFKVVVALTAKRLLMYLTVIVEISYITNSAFI